ncbi:phosphoadenosine phosphosulfate reductase family protein [Xenorhabdus bovienii]|uniref:phosphoadenosine phosphosulfate reductase family protein n=1 Tax=Xenorhabdus bovienii TaxID=40576 RepID=UPI0023B27E9B|nr:phosphoadenosine phosphosulfate reductase family protein [Xenorhabdus bovienii]MDE9464143.1 phosphoadenosine phosphosulfate reductase family protein [Xenorhabdus bovienii]
MNTATIIVPSDMALMVREIERSYQQYLNEYRIPDDHKIIVNFSAGKDSTATLTIASHLFGDKVQGVMADTDNEHSSTIEYPRFL